MRLPALVLVIALLAGTAVAGAVPAAIQVTECGQRIPPRTTGFLSADLTCQGGRGVILEQNATFDLGGFTLSGAQPAVVCEGACSRPPCARMGRCEVRNGTIAAPFDSIIGDRVTVRDMTIDGGNIGTPSISFTSAARVDMFDSHLDAAGVSARGVQVTGSTFVKSGVGGNRVSLTSSTVTKTGRSACSLAASSSSTHTSSAMGPIAPTPSIAAISSPSVGRSSMPPRRATRASISGSAQSSRGVSARSTDSRIALGRLPSSAPRSGLAAK